MEKQLHVSGVDPQHVPYKTVYTGARIPGVGLGTFGSDRYSGAEIAAAVEDAIALGYRHIDCAAAYGNEHLIGPALQTAMAAGVAREDLWITSKLWNSMHDEGDVLLACAKTLKDLKLEYLDLYLVHWPFPNDHAPGASSNARDPHAVPYNHDDYLKTWRQMERLVEMGLVRHIGTSNMTIPKLKLLLPDAHIKPACNEMELHPHFQQPEFFDFLLANDILPIGYSPIGSPERPARDRSESDTAAIEDPVIVNIAKRLNVHPAVVCVKWAVQRGQVPVPFSVKRPEYLSNLQGAAQNPLTDDEMQAIAVIDKNCRLIKGVVFLWEHANDWTDLWDVDGRVAS